MKPAWTSYRGGLLAVTALYFLSASLGLSLNGLASGSASLVWPPTGLSLVALLLGGFGYWPAVSLGSFAASYSHGMPALVALGVAVGNTLEALLGAWLLRSRQDFHFGLGGLASVLSLIFLGALTSTLLSTLLGVGSLWLGGLLPNSEVSSTWWYWWGGNLLSNLIIAPLLLTWAVPATSPPRPSWRWGEVVSLSAFLLGTNVFVFADPLALGLGRYSLAFVLFPGLIWAALRFGQRGVTASSALLAMVAIISLLLDPPPPEQQARSLLLLQLFLAGVAATGLVLGAAVAARWRAEAERMALVEQLREAVRVRDEFLSVASHELKTPLTSLLLQVDVLRRALRRSPTALSEPQGQRGLERMAHQVGRLNRLIEALLDVSRIATGRLALERTSVDLSELVQEVLERHQQELERAHGALAVVAEPDLVGSWDRLRLEQVVTNLLTNAMKFGAGQPLQLSVRRRGPRAELQVSDHGIGIHPADQARIFERFERAVSAREFGGMGLGLYVSRQIIQEHGGSIRVESTPGQGATFIVELPLLPKVHALDPAA